jgi:hypothetical protein
MLGLPEIIKRHYGQITTKIAMYRYAGKLVPETLVDIPSRAKFPANRPKHQGNDDSVEESNCSVLRIPPV